MKVMVISSHTPSLFTFRMDMMKEFIKNGHKVIALGQEEEVKWVHLFNEHGIKYRQIFVDRNGFNPIKDIKTYSTIKSIMNEEEPNKIFVYQAKTIIYGTLAAKSCGVSEVYPLVAGLGSVLRGNGIKNGIAKKVMIYGYRKSFRSSEFVFVQNNDDKKTLEDLKISHVNKYRLINGSGVNLDRFKQEPLPEKVHFLFVGRLIKDKGIVEYLEACRILKGMYSNITCSLVGPFDTNPSALKEFELNQYIEDGTIEYFGEQTDIRPFLKKCSTLVLPSYHEGTPKVILEAMATGRSIITTDAPGCRETVIDGFNGFLVQVGEVDELVKKMEVLLKDEKLSKEMSKNSREIAINKYDVKLVNKEILNTMNLLKESV